MGENEMYEEQQKGDSIAFGIASMILGIIALLFFCTGCNILLAILAIVFGIIQLVKNKQKGMAITGIITGTLGILASVFFWIIMLFSIGTSYDDYDDFYDYYYDDYNDYYDDYYDDWDGSYYFDDDDFNDELRFEQNASFGEEI